MRPEHIKRFEDFLGYYASIHALDGAYATPEAMTAHRAAATELFEQSVGYLESLPLDGVRTVLDVGMGYGDHCAWFAQRGLKVTGVSVHVPDSLRMHAETHGYSIAEMDMHFLDFEDGAFDLVWSHHSLEHSFSQLFALHEWKRVTHRGGLLSVTVPPHKSQIVSGHFCTGWSVGQLAYMLGVSGLDISGGRFLREGYNVRGLVRRPETDSDFSGLSWMHKLRDRLPEDIRGSMRHIPASLGGWTFEGEIAEINSRVTPAGM